MPYLARDPDESWALAHAPRPMPLFSCLLARPPPTLRTLILHLEDRWSWRYDDVIDLRDLAFLDRVGSAAGPALSVRAELAETEEEEIVYADLEWDVRETLPGLDAQGLLSVVRVPPTSCPLAM